jgi:hypothetical protein
MVPSLPPKRLGHDFRGHSLQIIRNNHPCYIYLGGSTFGDGLPPWDAYAWRRSAKWYISGLRLLSAEWYRVQLSNNHWLHSCHDQVDKVHESVSKDQEDELVSSVKEYNKGSSDFLCLHLSTFDSWNSSSVFNNFQFTWHVWEGTRLIRIQDPLLYFPVQIVTAGTNDIRDIEIDIQYEQRKWSRRKKWN